MTSIQQRLSEVLTAIDANKEKFNIAHTVTLVVVSKQQSVSDIYECYNSGQRDFGESYVEELVEKSSMLPRDINWHMIGHLQSNKCKKLLSVANLRMIHSVDSISLAYKLNATLIQRNMQINALVQINTSGEVSKSGIFLNNALELCKYIHENCPAISFKGLMTIGEKGSSEDFMILRQCRQYISEQLSIPESSLELSMGMSQDFEEALQHGSNLVRVGTRIFGARINN